VFVGVRKEGSEIKAKCERRVRWKCVRDRMEEKAVGRKRCAESRLEIERI
jgi:hypothetical protein